MSDADYANQKDLARANRAFYQAFEKLDLEAMRAAWLDDPMVRCIHPGGEVLVGPDRVLASFGAIFANTRKIRLELQDVAIEAMGRAGVGHEHRAHSDECGGGRADIRSGRHEPLRPARRAVADGSSSCVADRTAVLPRLREKRRIESMPQRAVAVLEPEVETRAKPRVAPRWKVVLLNDDVTTFEFVIDLLVTLFRKDNTEAVRLTNEVHHKGAAIVTVTSLERGELYVEQVRSLARPRGYPLTATLEAE